MTYTRSTTFREAPMLWRASVAVSLLFVGAAQASWFNDRIAKNVDLKKEVGTGIAVIAQPTIESAQTAAHGLLDEADRRVAARLAQVDPLVDRQLGKIDPLVDRQLGKVDTLLENRIGQVDRIAATRLKDVDKILDKDIKRIDALAAQSIAKVDSILQARLLDVDKLLRTNIDDVDERIGARIQQIDELTDRRLGNVETIAAKSTAALGGAVLRLIGFACLLVFAAAAVWRVYVETTGAWPNDGSIFARISAWWRKVYKRLGWQLGGPAVCIAGLFLLFRWVIPTGQSDKLVETHRRELR